jgi:PTS system mannose-specific IIC component
VWVALLAWGVLVGLDLASVPQVMIARPLVAGCVAGVLVGDIPTGLWLGILFELLQHDILPLGAARYPEYGPATIGAVAAAHTITGSLGMALGAVVGLFTALLGGLSITVVRRANTRAVHRATRALEMGDATRLARLHVAGIGRDALRAGLVTAAGLLLAAGVHALRSHTLSVRGAVLVAAAAAGAALGAGASGTIRLLERGPRMGWFAAGLLSGVAVAWLR